MSTERFNAYQIMWLFVFFDLPTNTKKQRKNASAFRNTLIADGFNMFQYSVYMRHCPSRENAEVHKRRVQLSLPNEGEVGILVVTDKQFGKMAYFQHHEVEKIKLPVQQLELF